MTVVAKRIKAWKSKLPPGKNYPIDEALGLVKSFTSSKFNESVDVAVNLGIDASKTLIERAPRSAPGHYYLAMNSGELADAEAPSLAAYKLVHEIEREFKTAAELEVQYDFAGPARCLGLLYRDAPGWPLSVGSKHKAREWLERAVALAPDYPDNQLNLAESQLKWHQRDEAEKTLQTIATRWPAAQTNFTGETWEPDWHDWNTRRAALQAELEHPAPTRTNH